MHYKLENQSINLVWIAPLSPDLFTPNWFKQFDLLRDEDVEAAKVTLHNDKLLVDFGWLELRAEPNRLTLKLANVGLEQSYIDLIISIFSLLNTIPTAAIGLNTNFLYSFVEREKWDKIGNELVPKLLWSEENKSLILQNDVKYHFGMKRLDIEIANSNRKENDVYDEIINLTLLPKLNFEKIPFGLVVNFNHNLRSTIDPDSVELTKLLPGIIKSQFRNASDNDILTIESIFNRILS